MAARPTVVAARGARLAVASRCAAGLALFWTERTDTRNDRAPSPWTWQSPKL